MKPIDINGKTFGSWTVIGPSDKPRYVKCRCACGTVQDVRKNALMRGDTLGCNQCSVSKKAKHRSQTMLERQKKKYIGQIINSWKILDLYKKDGLEGDNLYCRALCPVCGKECNIRLYKLKDIDKCKQCTDNFSDAAEETRKISVVDGSSLILAKARLNGVVNKNSKTGYNGVTFRNGKYFANITFKKKHFYLGSYNNISDAIFARKAADELLYKTYLEEHEGWEQELREQLNELKGVNKSSEQSSNT